MPFGVRERRFRHTVNIERHEDESARAGSNRLVQEIDVPLIVSRIERIPGLCGCDR